MKNFYSIILLSMIFLSGNVALAQKFEVPKDYAFKTLEDYDKYEEEIISAINWLNKTPADQETEKRKEVSKFLIEWISGHPKLTVEINPKIVNFTENNPELLLIFMAGWTKFYINNKEDMNNVKGNMAGIKAAINFYDNNESLNKDKNLEKLAKLNNKGELRKWVIEQLKD